MVSIGYDALRNNSVFLVFFMTGYWNEHQLLNSKINPNFEENSPLYTYELLCIREAKGKPVDDLRNSLEKYLAKCLIRPGLYNQFPTLKGTKENPHKDDYMSHDQMTTIASYSYKYGLPWHKDIWKELKRQWFHYDNVNPPKNIWEKLTFNRVVHPRDILYIGYLAGSPICKMLSFLLYIIMYLSCKKVWKIRPTLGFRLMFLWKKRRFFPKKLLKKMEHTDGKLLTIVRCHSTKDRWMMKKTYIKCSKIIDNSEIFENWNHVFSIYFRHNPEHPILKELADFSFR